MVDTYYHFTLLYTILHKDLSDISVDRYAAFQSWKARWKDYAIFTELAG